MLPEYEHCKDRKEIKYYESVEQVSFQQKLPSSWLFGTVLPF